MVQYWSDVGIFQKSLGLCSLVTAMLKLGDLYWYGWDAPPNLTAAAEMYSGATTKGELPQVSGTWFMCDVDG